MYIKHNICLTQTSANKFIRKHGGRVVESILRKFGQLDDKKCVELLNSDTLSSEDKKKTRRAIIIFKDKNVVNLKAEHMQMDVRNVHIYLIIVNLTHNIDQRIPCNFSDRYTCK